VSALTLSLRDPPARTVDVAALAPDKLTGKTLEDIGSIELASGNRRLRVADLFELSGDSNGRELAIQGGSERLAYVGAGMQSGTLTVIGDCGPYAGWRMRGGRVVVQGGAGAFAGSEMRSGTIEVQGNAGDFVGAALPGDSHGMRGGAVLIGGNAGDRVGDRMRRGLILIRGNAGAFCGARMLAGTILVAGRIGYSPGFGLKHGTLLLAHAPAELPVTFQDSGEHTLIFLKLLEQDFQRKAGPFAAFLPLPNRVRRYCGDHATGAKGEILVTVGSIG
jgi:formylmethanofuran dehydrogenase subunit C